MLYLLNNVVYSYSLSRSLWNNIDRLSVHISWSVAGGGITVFISELKKEEVFDNMILYFLNLQVSLKDI